MVRVGPSHAPVAQRTTTTSHTPSSRVNLSSSRGSGLLSLQRRNQTPPPAQVAAKEKMETRRAQRQRHHLPVMQLSSVRAQALKWPLVNPMLPRQLLAAMSAAQATAPLEAELVGSLVLCGVQTAVRRRRPFGEGTRTATTFVMRAVSNR